jgi:hypothetical protein
MVFNTGSSVPNPAPIIGIFSSSPSSNQTSYLKGVQGKQIEREILKNIFFLDETFFFFPTGKKLYL